ncbi:MAG: hypothetical protein C5B46_07260 [Proteobacteria bacterium]|nr:MAG: hypothetical protein C5B46_07260 [Pseudomonadota bacterium]
MSDREVILQALAEVQRRFRLNRVLHQLAILLQMAALGLLLWRLLHVLGDRAAPASALAVLVAVLVWVASGALLLRGFLRWGFDVGRAAASIDSRAALRDEVQTAAWFIGDGERRRVAPAPWVDAQLSRAAATVARLDIPALLPIRFERRTLAGGIATVLMLTLAWTLPPLLSPADALASRESAEASVNAREAQSLRELIAQTTDPATADKLREALKNVERPDASEEEKRRALAAAEEAVEQRNLQAASAREGLFQAGQRLQGRAGMEEVAKALHEGDARKAAEMLQQSTGAGPAGRPPSRDADAHATEKDLERLLDSAAKSGESGHGEATSVAAREAIDRLKQIAEQLESQAELARAAQTLQQMQLAVAQRSQMAAGRFSQEAAQNSTAAPSTGDTVMPGGKMFRSAAVAQANKPSGQQEGSKTGNALGDSEAEAVLGNKITPLAVQLKRESVAGEQDAPSQEGRTWFYAESKEQKSVLESRAVEATSRYAQADTAGGEGIALRHRRIVKDYFIHLHEDVK